LIMKRLSRFLTSTEATASNLAFGAVLTLGLGACGGGGTSYSVPGATATTATVLAVSPAKAVVDLATSYSVEGANLTSAMFLTLDGGTCAAPTNVTSNKLDVVCTAGVSGSK
jgi:hypothetical protein